MKKAVNIIIISSFILGILSCSDKDCIENPNLRHILFYNFHQYDLDSVVVGVYKSNTNFEVCIDSYKVISTTRVEDDNYLIYRGELDKEIKDGYDYDVVIPGEGHFRVTSINYEKTKCNNSIFKNKYNYFIQDYYVNGSKFGCSIIKIFAQ